MGTRNDQHAHCSRNCISSRAKHAQPLLTGSGFIYTIIQILAIQMPSWYIYFMKTIPELYEEDQADRRDTALLQDFGLITKRDAIRLKLAEAIVAKRKLLSGEEYYSLAMLYQHGSTISHSRLAVRYAKRAYEIGYEKAKWLYAASIDRLLSKQGKSQKYGTQFIKKDTKSKWKLHPVDPTITDEERTKWNVPPLAEAKARMKRMNEER